MHYLPRTEVEQAIAHARRCWPLEGCGILAGYPHKAAHRWIPIDNTAGPGQFAFDTDQQIAAWHGMEAHGEVPTVLFHSHTRGSVNPSPEDKTTMRVHRRSTHLIAYLPAADAPPQLGLYQCMQDDTVVYVPFELL